MIDKLKTLDKELSILSGISALLHWDLQTLMPKQAASQRSEQIALLDSLLHAKKISGATYLKNVGTVSGTDALVVSRWKKDLARLTTLPQSHIEEFSKVTSEAHHVWIEAREKNNFSLFAPYLENIVALKIKEAKLIDDSRHPYDVLIYDFEEGMDVGELKVFFDTLKTKLIPLIATIQEQRRKFKPVHAVSSIIQEKICKEIANCIVGDKVVITTSAHPFTTRISPSDVRITTAFKEDDPLFSVGATAHECGHALYDSNLPVTLRYTTLNYAPSYGLHESQSRFWENHIALSREFWEFFYPRYQQLTGCDLSLDEFHASINKVEPSLKRVEADEVTYCMHVIIRFEMEMELLEGTLAVADVPTTWNKKYKEYLDVDVPTDSTGCLQDVQWSCGAFTYFPSYALGNVYAAMQWKKMNEENSELKDEIRKGDFSFVKKWLHDNIHTHGRTMLAKEIVEKACGPVNVNTYIQYLSAKYGELYGIKF